MNHKRTFCFSAAISLVGLLAGTALAVPAYIPLGDSNQIARVNATGTAVEALYAGVENAHGLAVSPDGKWIYAGSLLERPVTAGQPMERPVGVSAADHAAHHGGAAPKATAAPRMVSFITRMDAATGAVQKRIDVQRFTHHVTVTPDGRYILGVQPAAAQIAVVDAATDKLLRFVPVGNAPNYAAVTRDGSRIFISAAGDNRVTVLDGRSWRRIAAIPVGGLPEHLAFSPDESVLYVVNVGSSELSLIDTATLKEVRRVSTGQEPHGVAFDAANQTAIVSNKGADTLSIFDSTGDLIQTIPLGPEPYHVANSPGGNELWISSRAEGLLWRLSPKDYGVVGSLTLPGIGHQVASVP